MSNISIYPTAIPINTTKSVTITGAGTTFQSSAVAPVLTGPSGISFSNIVYVSNTQITANITTGNFPGPAGVQDPTTGAINAFAITSKNWIVENDADFSKLTAPIAEVATPGNTTITGGQLSDEYGGLWALNGPGVIKINVTAGGSAYTTAPSIAFTNTSTGTHSYGCQATANISGGQVTSVTITIAGFGYGSAPVVSFSGGGGTGATAFAVLGQNLIQPSGSPAGVIIQGGNDQLDRPAAGNALSQRIDLYAMCWYNGSSTQAQVRINRVSGTTYAYNTYLHSQGASQANLAIYYSTCATALNLTTLAQSALFNFIPGHYYYITLEVTTGTSGGQTNLVSTVVDTSAPTTYLDTPLSITNDVSANVQSIGQVGLSAAAGAENVSRFVSYTALSGAQILGSGTFALSAYTNTNITTSWTTASGGTAPYTYFLHRSLTSGFTPSGTTNGSGTCIAANLSTLSYIDTSPISSSVYYYKVVSKDSAGVPSTVTSTQVAGSLLSSSSTAQVLFIGDSRTNGFKSNYWYSQVGPISMTSYGSGYTSAPTVAISAASGSGATAYATISGGQVTNIIVTNNGQGYSGAVVILLTGGGFTTAATAQGGLAGGAVAYLDQQFKSSGGIRNTNFINYGYSGTTTSQWLPSASSGNPSLNLYQSAMLGAVNSTTTPIVCIDLGTNDSKNTAPVSQATYKSNITAIVTDLVSKGFTVILNQSFYCVPDYSGSSPFDENTNSLLQQYSIALDQIITQFSTSNTGKVLTGTRNSFAYFAVHTSELNDGLHPSDVGYASLANLWYPAILSALGLTTSLRFRGSRQSFKGGH